MTGLTRKTLGLNSNSGIVRSNPRVTLVTKEHTVQSSCQLKLSSHFLYFLSILKESTLFSFLSKSIGCLIQLYILLSSHYYTHPTLLISTLQHSTSVNGFMVFLVHTIYIVCAILESFFAAVGPSR